MRHSVLWWSQLQSEFYLVSQQTKIDLLDKLMSITRFYKEISLRKSTWHNLLALLIVISPTTYASFVKQSMASNKLLAYNELRTFLLSMGFVNSLADASLFIFKSESVILYLLVYVDDIIVTGCLLGILRKLLTLSPSNFHLRILGSSHIFLVLKLFAPPKVFF